MGYILDGVVTAFRLLWQGDPQTFTAIGATVTVSAYSMAASLLMGVPLGFLLGYVEFRGKRQVRLVVDTLLALPTVFIGLLVYACSSPCPASPWARPSWPCPSSSPCAPPPWRAWTPTCGPP
jgi:tungstate transport system permease protein